MILIKINKKKTKIIQTDQSQFTVSLVPCIPPGPVNVPLFVILFAPDRLPSFPMFVDCELPRK